MMYMDSHMDTPSQLLRGRKMAEDDALAQVDIPKLRRGGVGGAFFALYTPQVMPRDGALRHATEMLAAVYDLVAAYPESLQLAFSPEEVKKVASSGRTAVCLGMENGLPIGQSLSVLRLFHRLGVRYLTLTHNGDNTLADSASQGNTWNGLSPFGREVVREMNRLGMMIDLSHSSDKTFWDCIELSEAPVIATHSCCRALCGHRRNLTDEMLNALGEKDGYVGINFYPSFLSEDFCRSEADKAVMDEADAADTSFRECPEDPARIAEWDRMRWELRKLWRPGVKEIADHIDRAVRLAGLEHVGIGSDFDGIEVGPSGVENIGLVPSLWEELKRRGYDEKAISLIAGENLLSVWKRVNKTSMFQV